MKEVNLSISNSCGKVCKKIIEDELRKLAAVKSAKVYLDCKKILITYDDNLIELIAKEDY
ncbi:hypothetical protein BX659_13918 [Orenia metallireducens]|uniref:Uncharacterized protein n=1 Tax=Orenia metallireducens TaxID=1413210 RepID=A0A285IDZ7_9FIRM|nr:hypothetical protein [Orenia metallireducens]PRX19237.1 hypothetical protein BX659_13918 [Orenia metallireducens]SNY46204.1 hypothetical protein SAMN06265827_14112 [Orenia metallireducens]